MEATTSREKERARALAEEYRNRGYEVIEHPSSAQLPPFLADYHPDLLVRKGEEAVIAKLAGNPEFLEKIGLTEEQIETFSEGMYELEKEQITLMAEAQIAALEQARLMTAEEIDEKALMKAVEETGAISTELAKIRVRRLILLKKTLTPEQFQEIRTMLRRRVISRGHDAEGMPERRERIRERLMHSGDPENLPPPQDPGEEPAQ